MVSLGDPGQFVENFCSLSMGFEIFDGFYPCCVDNFYTRSFKPGQQLGARFERTQ